MQTCPHCGRENPDVDAYCYACGHVLASALPDAFDATGKLDSGVLDKLEPRRRWGTAYFDSQNHLHMTIRDFNEELVLSIMHQVVLGRAHTEQGIPLPDVDLGPFEALDRGVSRNHLALSRDQETISVTDLGSANGTYLNGQRLIPYEPRILRDNDELRLGRLVVRVSFT